MDRRAESLIQRHSQGALSLKESWRARAVQTTPVQHPTKHMIHITAVQTTGHLGYRSQTWCQKGKKAVLTLARALSGTISQGSPPSSPMQLGVAGGKNPSEENSSKNNQNALLPGSTGTKSRPNPMPCFLHTPSCKDGIWATILSDPALHWDEPQALQICPAQGPLSSRATAFSRNQKTITGGSQVQETHRCSTWAVWFPAKGQVQLRFSLSLGRSKKLISVGQYLTSKLFTDTLPSSLLCTPHTCSAVATHSACSPTLPCSTHPSLHIPRVKSGCALCHHHLIPPNHSSWTKRVSAWLQTSPKVDFFKEKPHREITTAVMAEFKVSNELGVVGCQHKTPDCSVGHRQWNALFSSSQLCSYRFHLSLVPSSPSQCSGCDTHDPLSRVGPQRVTWQAVWGESAPLITAFRGCAIYHRMESSHHTPSSLLTGFSVQMWQDRPESSHH